MSEEPQELEPELPTYTEYAVVTTVSNLGEAYVIQQVLAANDIPARIDNEIALNNAMGGIGMPIDGIQLFVPSTMLSEAARVLAETRCSLPETEEPTEQQTKVQKRFELFVFMFIISILLRLFLPFALVLGLLICSHEDRKLLSPTQRFLLAVGLTIVIIMMVAEAILIARAFPSIMEHY